MRERGRLGWKFGHNQFVLRIGRGFVVEKKPTVMKSADGGYPLFTYRKLV